MHHVSGCEASRLWEISVAWPCFLPSLVGVRTLLTSRYTMQEPHEEQGEKGEKSEFQ